MTTSLRITPSHTLVLCLQCRANDAFRDGTRDPEWACEQWTQVALPAEDDPL